MSIFPLKIPPGVVRIGTAGQSSGRYYDTNLIRWAASVLQPWRGWRKRITMPVTGAARALLTWNDNDANPWCAIGTHSNIYALSVAGVLSDITPSGFVAGVTDSSVNQGYGGGLYGTGVYGTPRPLTNTPVNATVVSLDTWGEHLVFCSPSDGKLYEWTLDPMTLPTHITGSPTTCTGALVTAERSLVALAAGGNPRRLQGSDLQDNTTWTPSDTNQAWIQDLQTAGSLMRGVQLRDVALYLTDVDAWVSNYVGPPYVYQFTRGGAGCGLIAKGAIAAVDNRAIWWANGGFWQYDGFVQQIPCEVFDFVTSNLNKSQRAKITAHHKAEQGEVTFHYPSAGSTENDAYVSFHYAETAITGQSCWSLGTLARTAGVDKGAFPLPMAVDPSGYIYEHEVGWNYDGAETYAETGPLQIGNSDQVMLVRAIYPDDRTLGEVSITFNVRDRPDSVDRAYGPYTLSEQTFTRFTGRKARIRFNGTPGSDWRIGAPELDIQAGGRR